ASLVDRDCRVDQVASKCTQPRQGTVLVRPGQATEPDNVCHEYSGELSGLIHAVLPSIARRGSGGADKSVRSYHTKRRWPATRCPLGVICWRTAARMSARNGL